MDASGSMLKTCVDRMLAVLNRPEAEKFTDDWVVRNAIAPAVQTVVARVNMTAADVVVLHHDTTLPANTEYVQLPPTIGEICRIVAYDATTRCALWEWLPSQNDNPYLKSWHREGQLLVLRPVLTSAVSVTIEHIPDASVGLHYSANGGVLGLPVTNASYDDSDNTLTHSALAAYDEVREGDQFVCTFAGGQAITPASAHTIVSRVDSDTIILETDPIGSAETDVVGYIFNAAEQRYVQLASAPTMGWVDRREHAYVGMAFRHLPAAGVWEERIIEWFDPVSRVCRLRTPLIAPTYTAAAPYEVSVPFNQAFWNAVALAAALEMSASMRIDPPTQQTILRQYNANLKTVRDIRSNAVLSDPQGFRRDTAGNPRYGREAMDGGSTRNMQQPWGVV